MSARNTCNYGSCLESIGDAGVSVSLRTKTSYEEKRAFFCCAAHAAASLIRLASDRKEEIPKIPLQWLTK